VYACHACHARVYVADPSHDWAYAFCVHACQRLHRNKASYLLGNLLVAVERTLLRLIGDVRKNCEWLTNEVRDCAVRIVPCSVLCLGMY
jgi:hypothetical protein